MKVAVWLCMLEGKRKAWVFVSKELVTVVLGTILLMTGLQPPDSMLTQYTPHRCRSTPWQLMKAKKKHRNFMVLSDKRSIIMYGKEMIYSDRCLEC